MAAIGNYIQVVIRGTVQSQQWQVSPTYSITAIEGTSSIDTFAFSQPSLSAWFTAWWNGWGALPTNGISDTLQSLMPEQCNVTEVRVYAKTNGMAVPEQAIIVGELLGERGVDIAGLPSYTAVSAFARSLTFGRKGASMRLPFLIEEDVTGNFLTETARDLFQTTILDQITAQGTAAAMETGLGVIDLVGDEFVNVVEMRPSVVQRINDPMTGKPTFPYEGFSNISAIECAPWSLNPWASTQNSRKFGRGR